MAISRLSLIKFLELAITIVCVILHYKSFSAGGDTEVLMLITGTFCGYFIILIGDSAGHLSSSPGRKLDAFYSLLGAALFIASGAFAIKYSDSFFNSKETKNYAMAKGILAIINGALFLVDSLFTWRGEH
ncbi:uncharacterized protein LOC123294705 [Chrysoperla carnea]|uniref:uncharacterized protein LOC123294705 n=1 Tax=Chrysoperla carnea TaxID=189513 RepID=UPI001D072E51|nr:uncharacterized protein LOC123294705 [Chrysoperla carnea]